MRLCTYKYRLYPSVAQEKRLQCCMDAARNWYNMCVAERKYSYELENRSIGLYEQLRLVKNYKAAFPTFKIVHSHILQVATADCDKAFKAFFRRIKSGEIAGYPRFKGYHHFDSFGFKEYGNGFQIDGRKLKLSAIGRISVRWHRPIEGKIKTVRITRSAGAWYACFSVEQADTTPLPKTGNEIGIDVGISALLTSDQGEKIDNPKWYRVSQKDLRIAQRSLQCKAKGGKNRKKALLKVQKLHEKVANTRKDFLNKIIYTLILNYDLIAVEDLRIKNMVRNPHLSKSILDAGWGYFREHLLSKAVNAGREIALVNPAYTSKTCSQCGAEFKDFSLRTRWVECSCGLSLDRDHNAAINILKRAKNGSDESVQHNVGASGPCVL